MSSRRMLKKKIQHVVNNIIEECYSVQLMSNGKHSDATNKIIDDAVDMFDDLLNRVQAAKDIKDEPQKKKQYESIKVDLEKASLTLIGKLNKIN